MVNRDRTAVTYRCECWRALPAGVIEAAGTIFLLLIAVRCYHAGPLAKALIAGGGSLGIGGLPLGQFYPELENCVLLCATEMSKRAEMNLVKEALGA